MKGATTAKTAEAAVLEVASTPESEENCAEMVATELVAFLKYGVIKNSVNSPTCESP